ncbi:hypothetical protein X977_4412 [Burkholderia pseudomallei MSHR7504]|nr:hypothetical protein X977_4412 [Burkholderia pseudomallei MSHR7504]
MRHQTASASGETDVLATNAASRQTESDLLRVLGYALSISIPDVELRSDVPTSSTGISSEATLRRTAASCELSPFNNQGGALQ